MLKYNSYVKESSDADEQLKQLKHFLGLLFKNSGITAFDIEAKDLNFIVYVMLSKTEKMANIMKVLDVCKKLHTDVLIQYNVEFDLWETKSGNPLMTFSFFLEEDEDDIFVDDEEDEEDDFADSEEEEA